MAVTPEHLRAVPPQIAAGRVMLRESDECFAAEFADAIRASHDELEFVSGWRDAADPRTAARALVRSLDLAGQDVVRHAFETSTGRYVGRLDLHSWDRETPRCELGYLADTRMTGRGLMADAARAMLAIAWDLGAVRVQAMCDVRNVRSIRFAEAIGMAREGTLRCYERADDGSLADLVLLATLRPTGWAPSA